MSAMIRVGDSYFSSISAIYPTCKIVKDPGYRVVTVIGVVSEGTTFAVLHGYENFKTEIQRVVNEIDGSQRS